MEVGGGPVPSLILDPDLENSFLLLFDWRRIFLSLSENFSVSFLAAADSDAVALVLVLICVVGFSGCFSSVSDQSKQFQPFLE